MESYQKTHTRYNNINLQTSSEYPPNLCSYYHMQMVLLCKILNLLHSYALLRPFSSITHTVAFMTWKYSRNNGQFKYKFTMHEFLAFMLWGTFACYREYVFSKTYLFSQWKEELIYAPFGNIERF